MDGGCTERIPEHTFILVWFSWGFLVSLGLVIFAFLSDAEQTFAIM